jgi:putative transposase
VPRLNNLSKVVNLEAKPLTKTENKFLNCEISLSELVEFYFKSFFQSYSLAFNKQHKRTGNLFQRPFKRLEVHNERYFTQAIIYIHGNAVKHKIVKDFTTYPWSSYPSIISDKPTLLNKQELIDWFGGIQQFIQTHKTQTEYYYNSDVAIEDE